MKAMSNPVTKFCEQRSQSLVKGRSPRTSFRNKRCCVYEINSENSQKESISYNCVGCSGVKCVNGQN